MEGTSPIPIFLSFRHVSEKLLDLIVSKNLHGFVKEQCIETASDKSFNISKYAGTICYVISQGKPIQISDAHEMISKKGQLTLPYEITTRVGKIPCQFIFIEDEEPENDDERALKKWASLNAKVISVNDFAEYPFQTDKYSIVPDVRVTCGLCTRHMQNGVNVTGHVTRKFGVSSADAKIELENNAMHMGKIFKGEIIELTVDGKPGGTIIMIPELGNTSHVTNNTTIRSALSGPVLEKYNNGIMEFTLKDIDANAKQNPNLKVAKIGETDVEISNWYVYCIKRE
jgi:hypothetical protein